MSARITHPGGREFAQFERAVHFALIDHAARKGERIRFSERARITREAWERMHAERPSLRARLRQAIARRW